MMTKTLFCALFLGFFVATISWGVTPSSTPPPQRIIALSPALTELIFTLHLEKDLVGVSEFSDFPKEAKLIKSVGPYTHPNTEIIFSLKPDLVLLPLEGPDDIKLRLDHMHVSYKVVDMRHLKDIGVAARIISQWLGNNEAGLSFEKNWNLQLKELTAKKKAEAPATFIEVQKSPLMAAGQDTFLNEMVTQCGGENSVQEKGYPKLSLEWAAAQKFKIVFLADYFSTLAEKNEALSWWRTLPSAQSARVIALNPDITSRPGPRLLQGMKMICEEIGKIQ